MKQSEATELLNQRLRTVFAPAWPAVPYALNNEAFRPQERPFARFIVANVLPEQRSMGPVGTRRFEYRGTFAAQLFSDLGEGTATVDAIIDSVRTMFQSQHLSSASDPMWTKAATAVAPIQRDGLHCVVLTMPVVWFNLE